MQGWNEEAHGEVRRMYSTLGMARALRKRQKAS